MEPSQPKRERRAHVRAEPPGLRARVRPRGNVRVGSLKPPVSGDGAWLPARVRDISADGIGLVLRLGIGQGTFLEVEFQGAPQGPPRRLMARVVHATVQSHSRWFLGCTLVKTLGEADLRQLLTSLAAAMPA